MQEWYRYDALGRRVLVQAQHESNCSAMVGCESTVERYVWQGDQMLYEVRAPASDPESDAPSGNGEYGAPKAYGRVGYTHAGGIDRPLGLIRMDGSTLLGALYPQLNWRGLYETATTDTAGHETTYRDSIKWPGALASAYLGATVPSDSTFMWFGSLITEQADASGLMYRRNRYYDPASGRFTQPDPAGIGGGLNSYGFAGGDPVSRSDPFGLAPADSDSTSGAKRTWVLGNGCPAIADDCDVDLSRAGPMAAAAGIGLTLVAADAGVAVLGARTLSVAALRAEYVTKVGALAEMGRRLLADGEGEESVARTLYAARRALGEDYKALTPMPERLVIYARNLMKYGDHLGPSIDYLRGQGKSWMDIIQSAARPGGQDLGWR